jgi:hypothetical protein
MISRQNPNNTTPISFTSTTIQKKWYEKKAGHRKLPSGMIKNVVEAPVVLACSAVNIPIIITCGVAVTTLDFLSGHVSDSKYAANITSRLVSENCKNAARATASLASIGLIGPSDNSAIPITKYKGHGKLKEGRFQKKYKQVFKEHIHVNNSYNPEYANEIRSVKSGIDNKIVNMSDSEKNAVIDSIIKLLIEKKDKGIPVQQSVKSLNKTFASDELKKLIDIACNHVRGERLNKIHIKDITTIRMSGRDTYLGD